MEKRENRPVARTMRALHRDIGFLILGLTVIYALSGVVLIYRGNDFLKSEKQIERSLAPNLSETDLGKELRMREFKVEKSEGETLYFRGGSYNQSTGVAIVTVKELIFPFNKFASLHKAPSNGTVHWFTTVYGVLLFFMAVSAFWMFKPQSKRFRRGMIFVAAGVVLAVVLLFLK